MTKTIKLLLINDDKSLVEGFRFVKLNNKAADKFYQMLVRKMFKELE